MSDKRFNNNNLKSAIIKSGMTREQIAEKVGCDTSSITKYCNGDRYPKTDIIIKLAELFNCSTDYLLGVSDAKTDDKNLQFVCDYIGLRVSTIARLRYIKEHKKPICSSDMYSFQYYLENLTDNEYEQLQKGELNCDKVYQDIRLSEFFDDVIDYLVNNIELILNTIELSNNSELIGHKTIGHNRTEINANLYELTTKYINVLHLGLGLDSIDDWE